MIHQIWRIALVCAAFAIPAARPAGAQANYPNAPIKVIIPLAPGGAIDVMVRAIGKAFEERTGHGFVVESKPGANTIIAANACKAAPPDGYTICLLSSSTVTINPSLYKNLSYSPLRDFEPITQLAFADQVLVANNKVPVKSWQEFVEYSKKNADKLNFGSFGLGGDSHLIVEWLKHESGAKITHVPFRGAAPAMMAFTGNDIQVMFLIVGNLDLVRQINSGEVTGLLVGGSKRSPLIPKVPSVTDVGITSPVSEYRTWFGLFAPKGTPPALVQKLSAEFAAIVSGKAFADQHLTSKGFTAIGNTPEAARAYIVEDEKRGKLLVQASGIQLDQ